MIKNFDPTKHYVFKQVGTFAQYSDRRSPGYPHGDPGFVRTTTGGAWLYRVVPDDVNVLAARDKKDLDLAAHPYEEIMEGLAQKVNVITTALRGAMKGMYRRIHILAVATPTPFVPSDKLDPEMRMMIGANWPPDLYTVDDRFTLIGVELYDSNKKTHNGRRHHEKLSRKFWRGTARGLLTTTARMLGTGLSSDDDFVADRDEIDFLLQSAGCLVPTMAQMDRANAWWMIGDQIDPLPMMFEADHVHTFPNVGAMRAAQAEEDHDISCEVWGPELAKRGSYPITFVTLGAIRAFKGVSDYDPRAHWGARLLASTRSGGMGALAVSVRGLIEPGEMTQRQIDEDKATVAKQVIKQEEHGEDKNQQMAEDITFAHYEYGHSVPKPTLIEGSVIAAIPAIIDKPGQVDYPGVVSLNRDRQQEAFYSMEIGSPTELNNQPVYWPEPIVAQAGLSGVARAGEGAPGALLGFTETDRQPVYVNPFAQSKGDTLPLFTIIGNTGSGKTYAALHLASQWARMRNPKPPHDRLCGVFFDPKPKSDDWAPFVKAMGGTQIMLDNDSADGILDPIRCMGSATTEAASTATEMLTQIAHNMGNIDVNAMSILSYGLMHGADSIGGAVKVAYDDHMAKKVSEAIVPPEVEQLWMLVQRLRSGNAAFKVICGLKPGKGLSVSTGLTLLSAGNLDVTGGGGGTTAPDLIKQWVVRMAALGGAGAIMGRNGFIVIDEAWMLLGDTEGARIVERFGRLARAQHYLPVLCSQKVDEFVKAKLGPYIGRGLVLSMDSNNEQTGQMSQAQAACALFSQPTDGVMHRRMGQGKYKSLASREPNYDSLFALTDKDGHLVRGSVGFYINSDRTAVPVEITIPPAQMALLQGKTHNE